MPIVDTCADEAIQQWGKHDLFSYVYLQLRGSHVHGDRVETSFLFGFLPFRSSCCFLLIRRGITCSWRSTKSV